MSETKSTLAQEPSLKAIRPGSRYLGKLFNVKMDVSEGHVRALIVFDERHEGPPGHAHGGSIASVMDEVMGTAAWSAGYVALAAHLSFDYEIPVPLGVPLVAESRIDRTGKRSIHTSGELCLEDGSLLLSSKGVFVHVGEAFPGGESFRKSRTLELLVNSEMCEKPTT